MLTVMASAKNTVAALHSKSELVAMDARTALHTAQKVACYAEAQKAVTGSVSDSTLSMVDSFLAIATPIVAFSGDFELTTLLSSLKLWVSKKRMELQMTSMQNQTPSYSYTY